MKRILITGAGNLKNNGIYSMVASFCKEARKIAKEELNIYMLSRDKKTDQEIAKDIGIEVLDEHWWLLRKNKPRFILNTSWNMLYLILNRFARFDSCYKSLIVFRDCDLIVDLSGDSLTTDYGAVAIFLSLYSIYLGLLAKKKVILLGQTIGPFKKVIFLAVARYIISRTYMIILRERKSYGYMSAIGIKHKRIFVLSDIGFLMEADEKTASYVLGKESLASLNKEKTIGFSPSSIIYKWLKKENKYENLKEEYLRSLSALVDNIISKRGYKVLLIPHVTLKDNDDTLVCEAMLRGVKHKENVLHLRGEYNASILKSIIGKVKYLIAFRMHAAISAISQNIPVISWSYNNKFEGVLGEKGGLSDYIINIRDCSVEEALEKTEYAIDRLETNYEKVKSKLMMTVSTSVFQAREAVKQALGDF